MMELNENKRDYINAILAVNFSLSEEQKKNPKDYFDILNSKNEEYLDIAYNYREEDKIDGDAYLNKIFSIISDYKINEKIIIESIKNIGTKNRIKEEFKDIPDPLKLEFYISILIAIKYGKEFAIKPNYKADHIGRPYSHAPWNQWDIEVFSKTLYWLIEVTLIRNKTQQLNNETTSVIRHLNSNEELNHIENKYISFIAPFVHEDTSTFFDFCIFDSKRKWYTVNIKPYTIDEFTDITLAKNNLIDMEEYSSRILNELK